MTSAPIRTPDQRLRIFVSSTLQELADERGAAKEAIQHICLTPVMFELGARAHPPRDLYRAYLAQSDVFVGIYWQRYGWIAPGEAISGLEDEYVLARGMPKLIYIKRAETREERLSELVGRIQSDDKVSYRPFADAAELKDLIQNDLALMLTERFTSSSQPSVRVEVGATDAPPLSLPPVERGALIGRDELFATLTGLVAQGATGCLTLTGPGGTGKTALAIHAAHTLAGEFADGVFYVPLASVRSPADVVPHIVSTLEIPLPPSGGEMEKLLIGFLRARRALLVLDNFEQVLGAASDIGRVLAACPHLKIVATSREALRIKGERELPVPPLAHDSSAAMSPAMKLFEQRAQEIRPDFCIDNDNRSAVAEICRRLDALPLAIELAAARVRVLSPQQMLPRLDKSLALLTSGRRDLPARQQTLRGALEWSLDLLNADERVFFRRLGVFAGSFSDEAAAAAVGDCALDVLDGLTSLVEKSLLVRTDVAGQARLHMLETVRELARERVAEAGEERDARLRHAAWIQQLLDHAAGRVSHAALRQRTHEILALEEGNIRAAFSFLRGADGDREKGWELYCALALVRQSEMRGGDVLTAYREMIPRGASADPTRAALACALAAWTASWTPTTTTRAELQRGYEMLEGAGDRRSLPAIAAAYGTVLSSMDREQALPILDRAVALAVETSQHTIESWARMIRFLYFIGGGDFTGAERAADELIAAATRNGEQEGISFGMTSKGRIQLMRGDLAGARESFAKATVYSRARSGMYARADALTNLAGVLLALGEEAGARAILEEIVYFSATRRGIQSFELCWGALAFLLAQQGERERARELLVVLPRGVEEMPRGLAMQLDPTGFLAKHTKAARELLGNPDPMPQESIEIEAALRAALGR